MTAAPDDDQIIVTVRRGLDETARWRLQPEESSWQIAQIVQDLEEHLLLLLEREPKGQPMTKPDAGFEQVELSTGNEIMAYYDRANDQAVVFVFTPEGDDTVSTAISLVRTNVESAQALIEAFRTLEMYE